MNDDRLTLSAGAASVAVALGLIGVKLWALAATGSLAVGASLADSVIDLAASAAGLAAIAYAARPADDDHRFGHGSVEDIAAVGQALLILAAAGLIGWGVVDRARAPSPIARETAGMAAMLVSIAATAALVAWQTHVARRTRSPVVAADRLHYVADLAPNLGALLALAASRWLGLDWVDVAVAALAAALLAHGAARILGEAFDALMDREAAADLEARLDEIADGVPGLEGVHDTKSRRAGRRMFIQTHAEIDGALPLAEAHEIGEALRRAVVERYPGAEVIIHKDPV